MSGTGGAGLSGFGGVNHPQQPLKPGQAKQADAPAVTFRAGAPAGDTVNFSAIPTGVPTFSGYKPEVLTTSHLDALLADFAANPGKHLQAPNSQDALVHFGQALDIAEAIKLSQHV